jgi:succinoglycan biosynthesis transport protein ExoP
MSKNFELLQRAAFSVGAAPAFTPEVSVSPEESVTPAITGTAEVLSTLVPEVREEGLKLVQRLFLMPQQPSPRAVVFAGVDANIGCDWLCSVTANLLAKSVPGSVCLAEGNFRQPSIRDFLGTDHDRGFIDALRMDDPIEEFAKPLGPDSLWLLPAGAPVQDSAVLLNSERMKERITELRKQFDYLILNAPPLSAFADAMVLGRMVDGVVLVLEANSTRREAALRATESLRAMNIPVLGAVLNNRTFPIPTAVYKRL